MPLLFIVQIHWRLLFAFFFLPALNLAFLKAQGFSDESIPAGIVLKHDGDQHPEPNTVGSGAAWLDFNNDGFLDAYITMRLGANRLYQNNGDGTFTEVGAAMGVQDAEGDGGGVAVADFNNDGWEDLYLANCDEDRLFKNINGTHFEDITAAAGFDLSDDSRGVSASWGDYDQDGFLDLYVVHHIPTPEATNADSQDKLYHNNGDETFTDVSHLLMAAGPIDGYGFIGGWTDFDRDNDLDIILINDCLTVNPEPTRVFRNDGGAHPAMDWKFTEVSLAVGIDDCRNGMGIAIGDYNRDGWMDIYYSSIGECVLFQNKGGVFTDATAIAKVGNQAWPLYSWGTSFFDYDLDGWQDLYVVLGPLRRPVANDPHRNILYRNNGNGFDFTDVSALMNMDDNSWSRNGVFGDYDNDGFPDVLLVNYGQLVALKRNNTNNGNHYLKVELIGKISNRDGIGSRLKLTTPDGLHQYYETRSGSNLGGGDCLDAHFGLGDHSSVTELEITWPSGIVQRLSDIEADQRITIEEPEYTQSFAEVAAEKGVLTGCGSCGVGCGLSFADFNGDGWDDLTFGTQKGDNILFYQNNNGTFELIEAPIVNTDKNEQILWVDYDNDGDKDLFVTNFEAPNRLYNNDGQFNMTEVTALAGLPDNNNDPTYGAVFGDYDKDGWLDIYIANWSYRDTYTNYLYKNNGDGTFSDVTVAAGVADGDNLTFCSAFFDYNNDGLQDLYNSQDRPWSINTLFKNTGEGHFEDVSAVANADLAIDAMSVTVGDYDNDGDQDVYITNTPLGNKLLRNNGDETFTEVADAMGVGFYKVGWGANFFDCDNDLDLDLYVSAMHMGTDDASSLYVNDIENNRFIEAKLPGMAGDTVNSFSNAVGDFNNDGLPDVAVNNADASGGIINNFHLWQNRSFSVNNWIKIKLEGVISNREGVGSWIEVYVGGQKYVRYKHCGIAYLAQNSDTEHIGLGKYLSADSIIVKWLSGNTNKLYKVAANQTLTIVEETTLTATEETFIEAENRPLIGDFYPNPIVNGQTVLPIEANIEGRLTAYVFDSKGKLVLSREQSVTKGGQLLHFELASLPEGVYFVKIETSRFRFLKKLILVK